MSVKSPSYNSQGTVARMAPTAGRVFLSSFIKVFSDIFASYEAIFNDFKYFISGGGGGGASYKFPRSIPFFRDTSPACFASHIDDLTHNIYLLCLSHVTCTVAMLQLNIVPTTEYGVYALL